MQATVDRSARVRCAASDLLQAACGSDGIQCQRWVLVDGTQDIGMKTVWNVHEGK